MADIQEGFTEAVARGVLVALAVLVGVHIENAAAGGVELVEVTVAVVVVVGAAVLRHIRTHIGVVVRAVIPADAVSVWKVGGVEAIAVRIEIAGSIAVLIDAVVVDLCRGAVGVDCSSGGA